MANEGRNLEIEAHAVLRGDANLTFTEAGLLEMIDTFDRPAKTLKKGTYAGTENYAYAFEDKPGKRLPKFRLAASAGVGHARAEWSIFDAEAKGPNASAGIDASAVSLSARAFARAEIASASASAGPLKAKAGLSLDMGVGVAVTGLEFQILGTGFSFGRKMGLTVFGNGFEFNLW